MDEVVCLHGFLGAPTDFDSVRPYLDHPIIALDLYESGPLDSSHDFVTWTENFRKWASNRPTKPWLMGYSMGGRLALHVAMLAPEAISGVLLISTHPGIHDPRKISERNQWERMWAETFRHFPLEQALERWNQQDVFQGTAPKADWRPLPVDSILQSLTNWSTTRHRFDWAQIRKSKKTRWVVGARDPRYVQLMEELWDGGRAEVRPVTVLPDSGHRVLSDAPISLAQTLVRFIVSERQRGGDL